jgi:hypothetical protein
MVPAPVTKSESAQNTLCLLSMVCLAPWPDRLAALDLTGTYCVHGVSGQRGKKDHIRQELCRKPPGTLACGFWLAADGVSVTGNGEQ